MKYKHLPDMIHSQAAEYKDKNYIIFLGKELTYNELDRNCSKFANVLEGKTVYEKKENVGIFLPNGIEFVITFFGIMYAGGTALPFNTLLKSEELLYQINHSQLRVLITNIASYKIIKPIRSSFKNLKNIIFVDDAGELLDNENCFSFRDEIKSASDDLPKNYSSIDGGDIAGMMYTSGTTGKPKGCMLSHNNYLADLYLVKHRLPLTEDDTNLCIMPLFHVNGQVASLLITMLVGGTLVLEEMFKPRTLIATLEKYKCATFSAVPAMYNFLNEMSEYKDGADLSFLKACICGAAPMPVDVFNKFERKFKAKIIEGYGLTEGTCASSLNPLVGKRKIGSIGIALEGQEMAIVDDKNNFLPDGEIGEIVAKGENIMVGYFRDEEATKSTIVDGWLHTGDLGYRDNEGYYFITGRKKEMIIRGGENIYPKEIEEVLYEHDNILECAVIGMPDKKYGETVVAVIKLKEGTNENARTIKKFLTSKLANYKCPNKIEFTLDLPKTSTGKIQKLKLRDELIGDKKLVMRIQETLHIPYRWAYGKSLSFFFTELKNNKKIWGIQCPKCKKISCPPKSYCGVCYEECTKWVELGDIGTIETYTTIHMSFPGQHTEPPYVLGWIKLLGSHTHLFHTINAKNEDNHYVGKKAKVVWRDDNERTGSIYDIKHFDLLEDEE
jgi:long-chain acyl-CoA synthetase